MKKFFFIFTALAVLTSGCFRQAEVKSSADPTVSWISGTEAVETADGSSETSTRSETKATAKVEAPAEVAKPEPPAAPQPVAAKTAPAPATPQPATQPAPRRPAPEPVTHTIPMGPSGTPGVILRNPRTMTYRPAYAVFNKGFMLDVRNNTKTFLWVSTSGYVNMQPLVGQCMESRRLPPVPRPESCPFVELPTKSGTWVTLIKPDYSASFVIDSETCPPDGSDCKANILMINYTMEAETLPIRRTRRTRSLSFPETRGRTGNGWTLPVN